MSELNDKEKKELVEKFRKDYESMKSRRRFITLVVLLLGIVLFIGGIITAINGFKDLISSTFGGIGGWIAGIFTTMGGIFMIIIGSVTFATSKRDTLVPYIKKRFREEELKNPDELLNAVEGRTKEPTKICEYCGHNNEESESTCTHCGASI